MATLNKIYEMASSTSRMNVLHAMRTSFKKSHQNAEEDQYREYYYKPESSMTFALSIECANY